MTDQITKERALDLLRQAVNQDGYGPEYVYPYDEFNPDGSCTYVRGGAPSCVVGHALSLAGVDVDRLASLDAGRGTAAQELPRRTKALGGVVVDEGAALVFRAAQTRQDEGETWGESLRGAEAAAR